MRPAGSPGTLNRGCAAPAVGSCSACRIEHFAGVDHDLVDCDVPRYAADAKYLEIGVAQRVEDRQGIVRAGVNIRIASAYRRCCQTASRHSFVDGRS